MYNLIYAKKNKNLYETSTNELTQLITDFRARATPELAEIPPMITRGITKKTVPRKARASSGGKGPIDLQTFSQACAGALRALKAPEPLFSKEDLRYDPIFAELM